MSPNFKHVDQKFGPFFVDDGTGRAYIDPSNSEFVLTSGDEYTVEGGQEPPEFITDYLNRETDLAPISGRKRWYTEFRLDVGEQVRVAGESDPDLPVDDTDSVTTAIADAGDAPKFYVTDDAEIDLRSRTHQMALRYILIGSVLLAFSVMLFFFG